MDQTLQPVFQGFPTQSQKKKNRSVSAFLADPEPSGSRPSHSDDDPPGHRCRGRFTRFAAVCGTAAGRVLRGVHARLPSPGQALAAGGGRSVSRVADPGRQVVFLTDGDGTSHSRWGTDPPKPPTPVPPSKRK